jgi:Replicative DNA helicase
MTTTPAPDDTATTTIATAEQAIIGAALLNPTTLEHTHLGPDHFADARHGFIWAALLHRHTSSKPIGPLLIADDLAHTKQLSKLPDGAAYLHTCLAACPDPSHAPYYEKIIVEAWQTRTLQVIAERLRNAAALSDTDQRGKLAQEALSAAARALAPQSGNGHGGPGNIRLTPASEFEIRPVKWVWDQRIPRGEITLIPGREGTGKSTYLAWLAAAITNGNLPGLHHGTPKAVLYAASEDSWHYTIAPRLLAAGANLDLVYRIDVDTDGGPTSLNLPRDCRHLADIAAKVDAAVLMCDPILSLIDEVINTFKATELRHALEPLRRAAEAAGLAVVALVHFNKSTGTDVLSMISGSRAWGEVARAVIAIAHDKTADDYTCVVSQGKNNLGRNDLPHLTYTIDSVVLETSDGDAHIGRLRWTGETEHSAEDILNRAHQTEQPLSDNAEQIVEYLAEFGHPLSAGAISDHFVGDIKPATVRQALRRLVDRKVLETPTRGNYTVSSASRARARIPSQSSHLSQPQVSPLSPLSQTQSQTLSCDRGGNTRETRSDSCDGSDVVTGNTGAVTTGRHNEQPVTTSTDGDFSGQRLCVRGCGTVMKQADTGLVCRFCVADDAEPNALNSATAVEP